jgi:hypothetical protein
VSTPVEWSMKRARAEALRESWSLRHAYAPDPVHWCDLAPCRGQLELFYADDASAMLCDGCPVRPACLRATLAAEHDLPADCLFGVAGGMTAVERACVVPRPQPPVTPAPVVLCGTNPGYRRHRRRGEWPCSPCRKAHAAYQLSLKRGRAARGRTTA